MIRAILLPISRKGEKIILWKLSRNWHTKYLQENFRCLSNRFIATRNSRMRPYKTGFKLRSGCANQIFTLRKAVEHRSKYRQPITLFSLILQLSSIESIERIWQIIGCYSREVVRFIMVFYQRISAQVQVYGKSILSKYETGSSRPCTFFSYRQEMYKSIQVIITLMT